MKCSTLDQRIEILTTLAKRIHRENSELQEVILQAKYKNPWFSEENTWMALENIKSAFLDTKILKDWVQKYPIDYTRSSKVVGLILAGNIPLVGFHDVISVFLTGHISHIKYSEKDELLLSYLIKEINDISPDTKDCFKQIHRLKDFDAVIATGSNNAAGYFDYYFAKYPHIIRRNRSAVGILDGSETKEDFHKLSKDVFSYFGLGCRNISKIYVPKDYVLDPLLELMHEYNEIIMHDKYKNNFDYNVALYLLNMQKFVNNGCIVLKHDANIASRIACLNYDHYEDLESLSIELQGQSDQIQCIAYRGEINGLETIDLGQAQCPAIDDYADGVDTLSFLSKL